MWDPRDVLRFLARFTVNVMTAAEAAAVREASADRSASAFAG
jgi:hypothetical protein